MASWLWSQNKQMMHHRPATTDSCTHSLWRHVFTLWPSLLSLWLVHRRLRRRTGVQPATLILQEFLAALRQPCSGFCETHQERRWDTAESFFFHYSTLKCLNFKWDHAAHDELWLLPTHCSTWENREQKKCSSLLNKKMIINKGIGLLLWSIFLSEQKKNCTRKNVD